MGDFYRYLGVAIAYTQSRIMSFPKYDRYKDSGVEWLGEVPQQWELLKLKRICLLKSGENITSEQIQEEDNFPVFGGNGLRGYTDKYTHDGHYALIGRQGALCGNVNYAAGRFWASEHAVVVLKTKDFVTRWLGELLRTMNLNQYSIASAQPGLSVEVIGNLFIPLPPLPEQRSIAAFLDRETTKIDELIAEQRQLIDLLKEKRQAVISHAVTKGLNPDAPMKDSAIEWLGEVPEHWSKPSKLVDFSDASQHSFVNGPFGSDLLSSELTQEGIPVIYIRDLKPQGYTRVSEVCVTREKAEQIKFCNVIPGDILVAKVGDPPGLAVVYPTTEGEGIVTQDVIRLRLNKESATSSYVSYLLNSDFGRISIDTISVESTRTRVGLGDYKQLKFCVPPFIEQQSIAAFLDRETAKFDELIAEAHHAIALLRERRTALISAAVTGKIDVRSLV